MYQTYNCILPFSDCMKRKRPPQEEAVGRRLVRTFREVVAEAPAGLRVARTKVGAQASLGRASRAREQARERIVSW